MKKFAALVFVCTALVSVPMAMAQTQGNTNPTPSGCTPPKQIYAESNWQDPTPVNGQVVCYAAGLRNDQRHFRLYREYRQITPYRCQPGPRGTWAVPCSIISCESHFQWGAANPSGAVGPYQLLGWGAPYPARSFRAQVANHRIAARVYAGGAGRSNWVC